MQLGRLLMQDRFPTASQRRVKYIRLSIIIKLLLFLQTGNRSTSMRTHPFRKFAINLAHTNFKSNLNRFIYYIDT